MVTDARKIRKLVEIARAEDVKRLSVTPEGGIELELYPARAPAIQKEAEDTTKKRRAALSEKITYLSAGG